MKLLRTFPKDAFEFGLASWRWLGLREQTPRFATCFGDIFLESLDGWWFLDTVEGTLELRWTTAVTMYEELESPEGRATYLMDDLVRDARSRGIHLGEEDVYTFNPHPAVGGELGVNNLAVMRFELAVNWAGQIHDQVLHSSGEIRIPPMPDDGRRATAPQVAAAWDSAWSDDETFDAPFEQYLATTTFAAVATPAPNGGGYGYGDRTRDALTAPAEPQPAARQAADESAPRWSGRTEPASWPEPGRAPQPIASAAAPLERYDDALYPSAHEPYGAGPAGPEPAGPSAQHGWAPYGSDQDAGGHAEPSQAAPAWGNPTWGSTGWSGQAPAVATGGGPQQQSADPFTAWDDLWGRR